MVIFDCDGVLVDSEVLLTDVHVTQLRKLGLDITHAELTERFLGVTDRAMHAALEADFGASFPMTTTASRPSFAGAARAAGARSPLCCRGTAPFTRTMLCRIERCAGSSSLDATGLAPYFAGNVFSADVVAAGKPAPDIFLCCLRDARRPGNVW